MASIFSPLSGFFSLKSVLSVRFVFYWICRPSTGSGKQSRDAFSFSYAFSVSYSCSFLFLLTLKTHPSFILPSVAGQAPCQGRKADGDLAFKKIFSVVLGEFFVESGFSRTRSRTRSRFLTLALSSFFLL